MTGRHGTAHHPRHGRTLVAGAAGALGLGLLVVSLSDVSIADASETASPDSPAAPATSDTARAPQDRGEAQVPGARVVRAAAEERGEPYKYGADGPVSFDCSGLTQHVYAQFGVELPHNSAAQYRAVEHVAKADMRRGDMLFFHDQGGIYHVGIYAGGKQMWAAENPGEDVRKHDIWTDRFVVGRP
ncbi:MAG TPA: C40 family peptidase [Nocardioidaceae bacterium]|nr:C40 family peptidase [Nocardioidaceae bacterium]